MKNINKITKQFFKDTILDAYYRGNEDLEQYRDSYDEETANMFFISYFCENYPLDVLDWVISNKIVSDEDLQDHLADLICKKVAKDTKIWLEANSPMKQFERFMADYMKPCLG